MTDQEINEAMSEACGTVGWVVDGKPIDYLTDWNVVHAAVNELSDYDTLWFDLELIEITAEGDLAFYRATQRDWCEAYLRTKGLWKET